MFRQPSLGLAEIAWRWSVGLAATLLLTFSFLEYLDTLPVNAGELLLLRTRQPVLISQALARIFRGSAPRLMAATLVVAAGLALAWMFIAAFSRAATVRALLSYFREDQETGPLRSQFWHGQEPGWRMRSLVGLNFFRVAVTLAAAVGGIGALLLAGFASSDKDPSPESAFLIFLMIIMLVWLAWTVMNWFLSIAAVFVVADGRSSFGAVEAAVDLCRTRTGSVFAAGTWFGLAHLVVFFIATSVVALPLAFAGVLPGGMVLGGVLLVTLLYFAVVDFLYAGRLAAYVAILQSPHVPSPEVPAIAMLSGGQSPIMPELGDRIDPDELILSDPGSS